MNSDYWLGPYDVLVNKNTEYVVNSDEYNFICKNGEVSLIPNYWRNQHEKTLSKEEYLNKYGIYDPNTKQYYYNGNDGWTFAGLSIP